MKKLLLLSALALGTFGAANAVVWLPSPVITSEKLEPGKVTLEWSYDSATEPCTYFQVIVYKKHQASADGSFTLASTNFGHISSAGTMKKSEDRGAIWDYLPDCPGWWVKYPMYMNEAMGIDTFNYYAGSDNSDIFGGAYMVSPDYDLSNLSDKTISVKANLGNEAVSVSGGFAVWAWNTNWMDAKNIDYKPVYNLDHHYSTLTNTSWCEVEEACTFPNLADFTDPDDLDEVGGIDHKRSRVMFYGVGYSSYWINNFEVSVNMKSGETVDFGASLHNVEGNSFVIDTSADTDEDVTYAYEVRAVRADYDDYRDLTAIRFINYPYSAPRHVIGDFSGVEDVVAGNDSSIVVSTGAGVINISGAEGLSAQVYDVTGRCVYNGAADAPIAAQGGVFIVKVGTKTAKVIL